MQPRRFGKTRRLHWAMVGAAVLIIVLLIALFLQIQPAHAPIQETPKEEPVSLSTTCKGTMLFMGDTMLARSIGDDIIAGKDPYEFVSAALQSASLRIANIETTIADPSKAVRAGGKLYTFNAPLASIATLQQARIDVSVLANNHTSDFGASGTSDMLSEFEKAHLAVVGAGTTVDTAFTPKVVDLPLQCNNITSSSIKVGFIAANDIENVFTSAGTTRAGSAYFDANRLALSITQARQQGAEFIIAIPHWGVEYQTTPSARQVEWGHWFIDQGVDAVIGGHPHVIQPTEIYNGKPIIYSLGNFIFDQMQDSGANEGQMIELPVSQKATLKDNTATSTSAPELGTPVAIPYRLTTDGFPLPLR